MTKETKPDLYLAVTEKRDGEYFHLYARVVSQKYESPEWYPYGVDDDYSDGLLYSGLQTRCQGDARSQTAADGREPVYGFTTEYREPYSVDLRRAKRMVKTLDLVNRKLDKFSETRGYVKTYGDYLGRIAETFGCKGMVFDRDKSGQEVSGSRWIWLNVGDGVNRANNRIWQWQQEAVERAQKTA